MARDLFMLFGITNVSIANTHPDLDRIGIHIFYLTPHNNSYNQALQWMKSIDIEGKGFITEQVPCGSPWVTIVVL